MRDKSIDIALRALMQKNPAVQELTAGVDLKLAKAVIGAATTPLTAVERCYILLFLSGASTEQISSAMHVLPASVYTMRYRLRKRFPKGYLLPF